MTRALLALLVAAPLAVRAAAPLPGGAAAPLAGCAAAPPITLDEALALAARQSHDLAISRADAALAGADTLAAWQGLLPRLDLTSSAGHQFFGASKALQFDATTSTLVPAGASDYASYTLGLQLVQPLVDLSAWRRRDQAVAARRAADRTYDEASLSVAFDVTRRFYDLVSATRSLAVLEKAARRSEELVGRADALFAAGRAQKADTFTARVNLGNDRIAVEQARTRLVLARADLATSLGQPGDAALEVVPPAGLDGTVLAGQEPPPLGELVAKALKHRPTVAAAAAQVEAADAGVGLAEAGYLPTLSAQASYGRSSTSNPVGSDGAFGNPSRAYAANVGVVLNWNLFAGRSTEAAAQRARISAERSRATAARTLDGVARELTAARQTVIGQARQVALAEENLGAADQGLALARQRLEAGLASQLEVRDASLKLTQAELSLVQARIDHAVALADLNRAVGGAL